MNPKYKSIPLTPEAQAAVDHQLEAFRKKFSRDPKPEDPIFFDPDADEPTPIRDDRYEQAMIEAMVMADIPSELIYAFKCTGRLVTERNKHLLTRAELREWDEVIDEYHRKVESGEVV
jgi:hypothetical protein